MHVPHHVVHLGQVVGRGVDDQVRALLDDGEVVVGDEGGDLDDGVARRIESCHLEIDPGQHVAGMLVAGRGRIAGGWVRLARLSTGSLVASL